MRRRLFAAVLVATVSSSALATQAVESAFVDAGGEVGQALLVSHAGSCFAVVPTHVVGSGSFISLTGRGASAPLADALAPTDFGYDLSVMGMEGELAARCGPSFDTISRDVESLLTADRPAQANTVNPDGTVTRMALTVVDHSLTYVHIKPSYGEEHLVKGMSGSLITVDGKALGMLLSVEPESGVGRVIRLDRTLETVTPFFRSQRAQTTVATTSAADMLLDDSDNLLAGVTRWTAAPLDAEHRAENLLTTSPDKAPWLGKATQFPVQLVFDIRDDSGTHPTRLVISGRGLEGSGSLARRIEVLVDQTGRGRWKPIGSLSMPQNGAVAELSFPPLQARQLMLNIYDNWGTSGEVGLGRVVLTGP